MQSYLISSGGAPRKEGMTREDLLKGNAEIAAQLGRDIREYCPRAKFVVIIFNPADITGLVTQVHSGLPGVASARWRRWTARGCRPELAQHFKVAQDEVTGCRTYGGHGEMMAVFASTAKVGPAADRADRHRCVDPSREWEEIKKHVQQGGKRIIQLRGRSSFQSPSHQSLLMLKAVIDGKGYDWPCGVYVDKARLREDHDGHGDDASAPTA